MDGYVASLNSKPALKCREFIMLISFFLTFFQSNLGDDESKDDSSENYVDNNINNDDVDETEEMNRMMGVLQQLLLNYSL
ncbi:unnamed protein product [Onchocerca flexuosa]|uniref:Wsv293 n=1 Tax=Onchocerca flexuosa TaxID=387005 RepID=A0A183HNE4_9BILA|nr:unnamed protein product [Onchocerca flexuosa]